MAKWRQVRSTGLLWAVIQVVAGAAVSAVLLWILMTRLLRHRWPWQPGLNDNVNAADTTRIVLTVVGGVGAAVALVVAYRRQRDVELSRFDERFAAAASQLGARAAAERLAGVYAMAALADQWSAHRQQCIDVLCAYLRLPYDPASGLLKTVTVEHTQPLSLYGPTRKEIRTYELLPNDREVRLTIIRTINARLQRDTSLSWRGADLDFTGAIFDGGDFGTAVFSGNRSTFRYATFAGEGIDFSGAEFSGKHVDFGGAQFTSGHVDFSRAKFSSAYVDFTRAEFSGGQVDFRRAEFTGTHVHFGYANFSGGQVDFSEANFASGHVHFGYAEFTSGHVYFGGAEFTGGKVTSNGVDFRGWPLPPRSRLR